MKRAVRVVALVVAALSAAALAWAASVAGTAVRPVAPPTDMLARGFPVAAQAAGGRRVLVLRADPAKPRSGAIHESGKAPEGWRLFPGAPAGADNLDAALRALAAAASDAFRRDADFPPDVDAALRLFAVKVVLVDDSGKGAEPVRTLPQADPVLRVDAGTAPPDAGDPIALARALRTSVARESAGWTFTDVQDELWGGSVTIDAKEPGRFVFPYAARGGRVEVAGPSPATIGALGPLLAIDLPAGRTTVLVRFIEPGAGETFAVAGAAGLVLSLLALLLSFRPTRDEVQRSEEGLPA